MKKYKMLAINILCIISVCLTTVPMAYSYDYSANSQTISVTKDNGLFGITPPGRVWNRAVLGKYHFSGYVSAGSIYTEYRITGRNRYSVTVTNDGIAPLDVIAYIADDSQYQYKGKQIYRTRVNANYMQGFSLSGFSGDEQIFLQFIPIGGYVNFNGIIG